ncbi:MAG: hypothetical protein FWC75_09165 [Oscillospiraceae bacterium]|nr:hypothetical protein [Oscillospiraceae bacterium]
MGKRYVPKTYKNRRLLRVILGMIVAFLVISVVLFLILFFLLEGYYIDGQLDIPLLVDDPG